MSAAIAYDPFDDPMTDDPWPTYARLREEAPCYWVDALGCWVLTRFDDIMKVSMDIEHYTIERGSTIGALQGEPFSGKPIMFMTMDPPRHTPYRSMLSKHFTPRAAKAMEEQVRALVARHVAPLRDGGAIDAVADLAGPVAGELVCHILGLDPAHAADYRAMVKRYEPSFHHRPTEDSGTLSFDAGASGDIVATLTEEVGKRRASGRLEGLMQVFAEADTEDGQLDDVQVAINLMGLLIGGVETVPKHFGSVIHQLHAHPAERAKVVANPQLLGPAVEEVLRYDAPTHFLGRRVRAPVEIHGHTLEVDQGVLLAYAAGNRDPREFDDPERFDVERRPRRQLAFGAGIHLCMGLHFARLESRLMLEAILEAAPEYGIDAAGEVRCRLAGIHGYRNVPITR